MVEKKEWVETVKMHDDLMPHWEEHDNAPEAFAAWLILHVITDKVFGTKFEDKPVGEEMEVDLRFNGVKVPFMKAMKRLHETLDYEIKKQASKLLTDKLRDIWDKHSEAIGRASEAMDDASRELYRRLDLELPEDL